MTTENLSFDQLPAEVTTLKNEIRELKNLLLEKQDYTPTTEKQPRIYHTKRSRRPFEGFARYFVAL